jgi:hypothetical protein
VDHRSNAKVRVREGSATGAPTGAGPGRGSRGCTHTDPVLESAKTRCCKPSDLKGWVGRESAASRPGRERGASCPKKSGGARGRWWQRSYFGCGQHHCTLSAASAAQSAASKMTAGARQSLRVTRLWPSAGRSAMWRLGGILLQAPSAAASGRSRPGKPVTPRRRLRRRCRDGGGCDSCLRLPQRWHNSTLDQLQGIYGSVALAAPARPPARLLRRASLNHTRKLNARFISILKNATCE